MKGKTRCDNKTQRNGRGKKKQKIRTEDNGEDGNKDKDRETIQLNIRHFA